MCVRMSLSLSLYPFLWYPIIYIYMDLWFIYSFSYSPLAFFSLSCIILLIYLYSWLCRNENVSNWSLIVCFFHFICFNSIYRDKSIIEWMNWLINWLVDWLIIVDFICLHNHYFIMFRVCCLVYYPWILLIWRHANIYTYVYIHTYILVHLYIWYSMNCFINIQNLFSLPL